MLSVSDTPLSVNDGTATTSTTVGPHYPEAKSFNHRRLGGSAVILIALTLLVVGVANVQVARQRSTVEAGLATARVAASRIPDHLAAGDGDAVRADLDLLVRSANVARAGSSGFSWAVADRADLNGAQVRAVRRDSRRASELAGAAVRLKAALGPLTGTVSSDPTRGTSAPDGPAGAADLQALDDLDGLARGLSRYATAARRSGDPSAADLDRAAVAAGLLPGLAGADGPRSWTVCRVATGPCRRITLSAATVSAATSVARPGSATPPGRHWVAGEDLLVVGLPGRALFPDTGAWNAAPAFTLLYNLAPGRGTPTVTVRSSIDSEQLAIDHLSHRAD